MRRLGLYLSPFGRMVLGIAVLMGAAILWLALVMHQAFAQAAGAPDATGGFMDAVCSPGARPYELWAGGIIGFVRIGTAFRSKLDKAPPGVQAIVHFIALNWRTAFEALASSLGYKQAAKTAASFVAMLLISSALTACSLLGLSKPTGNLQTDLNVWAGQVNAYNTNFLTAASAFNAKVASTVVVAGKAACSLASQANGVYGSAVGQIAVQAGIATIGGSTVDVAQTNVVEAAYWNEISSNCAVVDAMDPNNPGATAIAAVQLLLADVPKLKQQLAKVSPTAAALIEGQPAG